MTDSKKLGTTVSNPVHRTGYPAYKSCTYCKLLFTALGLPRHWDHCTSNPKVKAGML